MRNLYARAASYQSLTPFERALLRLVEGLICTALVAALPIVADALASTSIDWGNVLRAALAAGAVAALLALVKYARAHADPVLADALDELTAALSAASHLPRPRTRQMTPRARPTPKEYERARQPTQV